MTLLSLFALVIAATASDPVVARVDAEPITGASVLERMDDLRRQQRAATAQDALDDLVGEALLAGEARRMGLERDPSVQAAIEGERRRRLVDLFVEHEIGAHIRVSDELVREMYHSTADGIRLQVLKLETEAEARAALDRLSKGADFAAEATKSLDPAAAAKGGDTGRVPRGQIEPLLAKEAFRVPVGSLFGPVKLELGWAIGKVLERYVADESDLAARREAIVQHAKKQLLSEARQHWLLHLRTKSGVKLDEPFLESLGKRVEASPAELDHVLATVAGRPLRYRDLIAAFRQLGGALGGHLSGPAVKSMLAWRAIDERLMEAAAEERGYGKGPEIASALPSIERRALANELLARIWNGAPEAKRAEAIPARIRELKERATILIDRQRLAMIAAPSPR